MATAEIDNTLRRLKSIEIEIEDFIDHSRYFTEDQWGDWFMDWFAGLVLPAQAIVRDYPILPEDIKSSVRDTFGKIKSLRQKVKEVDYIFPEIDQVELENV